MDSEGKRATTMFRYFIVEQPTFVFSEDQIYETCEIEETAELAGRIDIQVQS
jgi:hypothetical protein